MLAVAGDITTRMGTHLSGDIDYHGTSFASIPNGFGAFNAIPQAGLFQLIAFIGFLELFVMKDSANGAEPGKFPGDFRNGALDFGWESSSTTGALPRWESSPSWSMTSSTASPMSSTGSLACPEILKH
jgi:hypothetical protein